MITKGYLIYLKCVLKLLFQYLYFVEIVINKENNIEGYQKSDFIFFKKLSKQFHPDMNVV